MPEVAEPAGPASAAALSRSSRFIWFSLSRPSFGNGVISGMPGGRSSALSEGSARSCGPCDLGLSPLWKCILGCHAPRKEDAARDSAL